MKDESKHVESKGVGFATVSDASNLSSGLPKQVSNFEGSRGGSKGGGFAPESEAACCDGAFKQISHFGTSDKKTK